ncbi:MAG: Asp-tRNA(Asn)/Glu-tRNA(Gln) amidotransferase subunit GatC [Planctomycetia bacterium]|jgi:aspartyl-tRNA(Asn)/glutamyl-tRNA(Gln) amidotransferase subunit C|nr:Asp-tRNA(Asn)/Glu-tRNA(Gln) amidotransferase subunit GatC [Planctomycetia bacterium]
MSSASPSLSRQDVAKVALLSRLALSERELDHLTGELSKIVGFVSQLADVDTSAVEPLAHPLDSQNVFRDDVVTPSLTRESVLRSAPRHDGESFLVPAVLGETGAA